MLPTLLNGFRHSHLTRAALPVGKGPMSATLLDRGNMDAAQLNLSLFLLITFGRPEGRAP